MDGFFLVLCFGSGNLPCRTVMILPYNIRDETVARSVLMAQIQTSVGVNWTLRQEEILRHFTQAIDNVRVLTEPHDGGVRVIFLVQTRAILGEVVFIGNSLPANKLRSETELDIGKPLMTALEKARENIRDYYKKKGFPNVELTYKVDGAKQPGAKGFICRNRGSSRKLTRLSFLQ